jgi:hypothetical protein
MSRDIFSFRSYAFDKATKQLELHYGIGDLQFTETYQFDFEFVEYDDAALDCALQLLFYVAGVSYYKTFVPKTLQTEQTIDEVTARFMERTYQRGLGEFFYVNGLDPQTTIDFPVTGDMPNPNNDASGSGLLIGLGGGKDSLLSVEMLQAAGHAITTWSLNHRKQLEPLVERVGTHHLWVERTWDVQLAELVRTGEAYNGHVPISAVFAAVGAVVCLLSGNRDHIVSNEQSANEPTLSYQGIAINHQYSKSQAFERDFQELLAHHFGDSLRYYSLLRPLTELRIAELFARHGFAKYHDVFSSCNRAYTQHSPGLFWDGTCSKCAFVYLVLAPFVDEAALNSVIGHNLLLDNDLQQTYRQLLGIAGNKPLDCVGEVQESRAAMNMMAAKYPQLSQYDYELGDYDFRKLFDHEIPDDIYRTITEQLSQQL